MLIRVANPATEVSFPYPESTARRPPRVIPLWRSAESGVQGLYFSWPRVAKFFQSLKGLYAPDRASTIRTRSPTVSWLPAERSASTTTLLRQRPNATISSRKFFIRIPPCFHTQACPWVGPRAARVAGRSSWLVMPETPTRNPARGVSRRISSVAST